MIARVSSLPEALELAEGFKATGTYDWFRGQTRDWLPLRTSLARLDAPARERARERIARFAHWVQGISELRRIASDRDALFAIAQHYGIPTNYMDFTTEPRIAAFFATHRSPAVLGSQEYSCIICVNTHELQDFWSSIARVRPDWPEPRRVVVDVPELWRLQAQRGIFLFLPYEDFERIYDFDRIYFPAQRSITLIPEEDVYPKQKSDLEILLDQYFMIERLAEGNQFLAETIDKFAVRVQAKGLPEGIEKACFGKAGLPVLNSWSEVNLQAWREPTPGRWSEYSKAPRVGIELPPLEDPAEQLSRMARTLTSVRN